MHLIRGPNRRSKRKQSSEHYFAVLFRKLIFHIRKIVFQERSSQEDYPLTQDTEAPVTKADLAKLAGMVRNMFEEVKKRQDTLEQRIDVAINLSNRVDRTQNNTWTTIVGLREKQLPDMARTLGNMAEDAKRVATEATGLANTAKQTATQAAAQVASGNGELETLKQGQEALSAQVSDLFGLIQTRLGSAPPVPVSEYQPGAPAVEAAAEPPAQEPSPTDPSEDEEERKDEEEEEQEGVDEEAAYEVPPIRNGGAPAMRRRPASDEDDWEKVLRS